MKDKGWLLVVVIVALGLLPTISLQAQEPGLTETFDESTLLGWEHTPNATVMDGVLRLEPGGFAFHPGEWSDQTLTVRVRRFGEGELVISYRAGDVGTYHVVLGGDFLVLQREAGGAVAELGAAAPLSIPTGEWFQLGVSVTGSEHTVTLNGEPVLTAADPDPLPAGGVAFEVLGEATGEFDDLVVTAELPQPSLEPVETGEPKPISEPQPVTGLTWVRTGGPPGGLGYDIRYNFDDPNTWYVTDNFAGVHISTDNGLTWQPSNTGIPPQLGPSGDWIPIFCLTVDPHNPQTVWAGTDKTGHIYKSTDGGRAWTQMDNGVDDFLEGVTFRGFTVAPRSSDIVYAAGEVGSPGWAGEDRPGREFDMVQGFVYKTTDGGQNWDLIWNGNNLARYVWIDPRDPNVIYVSTGIFDREAANSVPDSRVPGGVGIIKSADGGQTWQEITSGLNNLYVGTLFMHPDDPDILLAGTGNNQYYKATGVYRTTDGGETWTHVLDTSHPEGGEVITSVELCPSDPNIGYAGGASTVYRTEDGGQTWELVSGGVAGWGPSGVMAGWPIDMQCDPYDPNRVFANNYNGGNFLSEDGGRTWQNASDGYTGAQTRGVAVDPSNPGRVYAAGRSGASGAPTPGVHPGMASTTRQRTIPSLGLSGRQLPSIPASPIMCWPAISLERSLWNQRTAD